MWREATTVDLSVPITTRSTVDESGAQFEASPTKTL